MVGALRPRENIELELTHEAPCCGVGRAQPKGALKILYDLPGGQHRIGRPLDLVRLSLAAVSRRAPPVNVKPMAIDDAVRLDLDELFGGVNQIRVTLIGTLPVAIAQNRFLMQNVVPERFSASSRIRREQC